LRKRIPEQDTFWELKHDATKFDNPVPGEIYEYEIMLRPSAFCFHPGDVIEIEITSIDVPTEPTSYDEMWHLCECQTCTHRIYRDQEHQSVLTIPILVK